MRPKSSELKALPGSNRSKSAIRALFETAHSVHGKIDVLVNNAGRIEPVARIEDSDVAEWSHTVDINLKGEQLCFCKNYYPL